MTIGLLRGQLELGDVGGSAEGGVLVGVHVMIGLKKGGSGMNDYTGWEVAIRTLRGELELSYVGVLIARWRSSGGARDYRPQERKKGGWAQALMRIRDGIPHR